MALFVSAYCLMLNARREAHNKYVAGVIEGESFGGEAEWNLEKAWVESASSCDDTGQTTQTRTLVVGLGEMRPSATWNVNPSMTAARSLMTQMSTGSAVTQVETNRFVHNITTNSH